MDIEDIQSNLHALRQLYGLLKNDENGLPNVTSETLDNKARLLLKSLLDSATEKVLKAHSQIIAGQVDASLTCTSAQPPQLKDSMKQEHLALSNTFKQSWEKQSGGQDTSSLKVEGVTKPASEAGLVEAQNIIFSASESENRRKRCRICQRPKIVKQFKPIGKVKISDHRGPNSIRVTTLQDKPSNQISYFCQDIQQEEGLRLHNKFCFTSGSNERENENGLFLSCVSGGIGSMASSNRPEFDLVKTEVRRKLTPETVEIPEDNNYLSKKVSEAIKQIELHISALQLEAKSGKNVIESELRNTVADCFQQMDISSAIKQTKGFITGSDPSQPGAVVNDSQYQLDGQSSVEPITPSNSLYQVPIRMMSQLTDSTSPKFAANQTSRTLEQNRYLSSQMARQQIRNAGLVSKHDVSSQVEEPVDEHEMQILKGNWFAVQDIKTILNKFESVYEPNSSSDHGIANWATPDRKDCSILQGQKKTVNAFSALSAINQDQDPVPLNQNTRKTRIPESTMQLKESKNNLQHQTTKRQTWLDSKHGQLTETRNLDKSVKNLNRFGLPRKDKCTNYQKRRYLQQEPEATASSSYSSRTSEQQASTYGSCTEDYSVSGQISEQNYTDASISSICSDSELYPSRHIRRSNYIIDSSSGENEVSSSSLPGSTSFHQRSSTQSGESEASSQYSQPVTSYSHDSSSKTCSPVRVYKSANLKKTKRQVGRWKKLKDKLGIIFHHHHHHHHHHHNNSKTDKNTTNYRTKVNHETPLPKHKGKSPYPPRKHEVYEEQAVQKVGKSALSDQHGKNQHQHGSHFHALVQGLMHTRRLKKSKPLKHGSLPSKKGKHGNKKAVKTSHWWQLLHHHGRFSKPPALLDSSVKKKLTEEFSKMK